MKPRWQKSGWSACAFCLMIAPAFGQWAGHLTKLSDAQTACRNIDSSACVPYLAEAVAVADTLTTQTSVGKSSDKQTIFRLPGPDGSSVTCGPGFKLDELNGETLTHLALVRDVNVNFYWSNALFVAALELCRKQ